jgi:hypothetical protein
MHGLQQLFVIHGISPFWRPDEPAAKVIWRAYGLERYHGPNKKYAQSVQTVRPPHGEE